MSQVSYLLQQQMLMRGQAFSPGLPVQQFNPLQGLPIPGGMYGNLAAQMFALPMMQGTMSQFGYMPGMFSGNLNPVDIQRNFQFQTQQQRVLAEAAALERVGFQRTIAGINNAFGLGISTTTQGAWAGTLASAAPMLSMMAPGMLDAFGGSRGSAVMLAKNLFEGGRYQIDPITGGMGLSTGTVGQMSRAIMSDLYQPGQIGSMRGITAGQLGSIYDEMSRRGMLGGNISSSLFDARDAFSAIRGMAPGVAQSITSSLGTDSQKFFDASGNLNMAGAEAVQNNPMIQQYLRGGTIERAKRTLKEQADLVSSMRDLFGANGITDAPIPKLIAAIDDMVGGMSGVTDMSRAANTIRKMQSLGQSGGLSLPQLQVMNQQAQSLLAQSGGNLLFAPEMVNSQIAFMNSARGVGMPTGWGAASLTQLATLDLGKREGARRSELANSFGAALRLAEAVGDEALDPAARQLVRTLRGQATGADRVDLSSFNSNSVARAFGAMGQDLDSFRLDRNANQRMVFEYSVQDQIRNGPMVNEMMAAASLNAGSTAAASIQRATGIGIGGAVTAGNQISSAVLGALMKASPGDLSNDASMRKMAVKTIEDAIANGDPNVFGSMQQKLAGMGGKERSAFIAALAEGQIGAFDTFARENGQGTGLRSMLAVNSPAALARSQQELAVAAIESGMRKEMAGQVSGPMQRIFEGIGNISGPLIGKDFSLTKTGGEFLSKALGGVGGVELNRTVAPMLEDLRKESARFNQLKSQLSNAAPGSPEAQGIMSEISKSESKMRELRSNISVFDRQGAALAGSAVNVKQLRADAGVLSSSSDAILAALRNMDGGWFSSSWSTEDKLAWAGGNTDDAVAFRAAISDQSAAASNLLTSIRGDRSMMRALGDEGRATLDSLSTSSSTISDLTQTHKMSIAKILAGGAGDDVATQMRQAIGSQKQLAAILEGQIGRSKKSGFTGLEEGSLIGWKASQQKMVDTLAATNVTKVVKEGDELFAIVKKGDKETKIPLNSEGAILQAEYGLDGKVGDLVSAFREMDDANMLVNNIAATHGRTVDELSVQAGQLYDEEMAAKAYSPSGSFGEDLQKEIIEEFGLEKTDATMAAVRQLADERGRDVLNSQRRVEYLTGKYLKKKHGLDSLSSISQKDLDKQSKGLYEQLLANPDLAKDFGLSAMESEVLLRSYETSQTFTDYLKGGGAGKLMAGARASDQAAPVEVKIPDGIQITGEVELVGTGLVLRANSSGGSTGG